LRVSRRNVTDPLNLLQIMLAKGHTGVWANAQRAAASNLPISSGERMHSACWRDKIMIATKDSFEPSSSEQLPMSQKIYVEGTIHRNVRVPMREIELTPTKSHIG